MGTDDTIENKGQDVGRKAKDAHDNATDADKMRADGLSDHSEPDLERADEKDKDEFKN